MALPPWGFDMNLRQAAQQALEALEQINAPQRWPFAVKPETRTAVEALRAALAEPEQEPVAWRYRGNLHEFDPSDWAEGPVTPLYTAPTPRMAQTTHWEGCEAVHPECKAKPITADEMSAWVKDTWEKCQAEAWQEPVAYCTLEQLAALKLTVPSKDKIALYTAPTPRKPLTDEDVKTIWDSGMKYASGEIRVMAFARAIERAHGIGDSK